MSQPFAPRQQAPRISLDGPWDYAILSGDRVRRPTPTSFEIPSEFDGTIRVPFSPEATASEVCRQLQPGELLWYRRVVEVPKVAAHERLMLRFGAVDWRCWLFANGGYVGEHAGGYDPFSFDITDAARAGTLELALCVEDPTEEGGQPRGKQRLEATDIWYRPQSGIWQSVWMEVVPEAHLERASLAPSLDAAGADGMLRIEAHVSLPGRMLRATVRLQGQELASASCAVTSPCALLRLDIPSPRLWSPERPTLYEVELRYGTDVVLRRCAFRTTTVEPDACGIPRFFLNGEPLMLRGVLYQPYWQESLMTPPSADALGNDIKAARDLGFNLIRVHAALMGEEFYDLCDQLGMLVCQDLVPGAQRIRIKVTESMPSHLPWTRRMVPDSGPIAHLTQYAIGSHDGWSQRQWVAEACRAIERLREHPCIALWCAFNEGWGQFEAGRVTQMLRTLDPTRPIDATSGWFDQGVGDFESVHDYKPGLPVFMMRLCCLRLRNRLGKGNEPHGRRALLLSECGGLTLRVEGHTAAGESFGYRDCADAEELAASFSALRSKLDRLWDAGLAGYIYTQLCDVEQECNGLLTYDRAVRKMGDRH